MIDHLLLVYLLLNLGDDQRVGQQGVVGLPQVLSLQLLLPHLVDVLVLVIVRPEGILLGEVPGLVQVVHLMLEGVAETHCPEEAWG